MANRTANTISQPHERGRRAEAAAREAYEADGAMPGRLSIFQRAMLQWNGMHPYNGVHVARIPGPLDAQRLSSVIERTLEEAGLTGLVLSERRGRYVYRGGPARMALHVIDRPADARAALEEEIRVQINRRFPIEDVFTPFRFFAVAEEESFYLGAAYCHFISDAHPVVRLLTSVAAAYRGTEGEGFPQPQIYPNVRRSLLPVILRHVPHCMLALPGFLVNIAHSTKPRYRWHGGHENDFALFALPREAFEKAMSASKEWGVTLNDVFLAALVKSVEPLAARRARGTRRKIAVTSIASMRGDVRGDASRQMAPLLGSFVVFHPIRAEAPLREVAARVGRQTSTIKRRKLYVRTIIDLAVALKLLPLFGMERQERFYRQNYPLWGGVTNFNLNGLSRQGENAATLDYFRAVSTGPACPLVFSITTYADALNIGVSYRTAAMSREDVEAIAGEFLRCVGNPEKA